MMMYRFLGPVKHFRDLARVCVYTVTLLKVCVCMTLCVYDGVFWYGSVHVDRCLCATVSLCVDGR